jgi:exopolysaccharide biosynthesis polyprenyl glycosylphosphotransferase
VRERIAVRPDGRLGIVVGNRASPSVGSWTGRYLRRALVIDGGVALLAGLLALRSRLDHHGHVPAAYVALTFSLPFAWIACVALARGYEARLIGTGADEFRRIINAGIALTGAVAILSYATTAQVARGYVVVAMPCVVALDLVARYWLRKRLHRVRAQGGCMRRAVAVGHPKDVEALINELRREPYHGLSVVAVCLAGTSGSDASLGGVPVHGGLGDVMPAVRQSDADTVAVLACPEMNGVDLRSLAWELEKTDTDLCLAPALLDVAGPRTSIRSAAGLPLLYVDHPDLTGIRQAVKSLFDRLAAFSALLVLSPLFLAIAIAIKLGDGGPVLFRHVRIGRDGRPFNVYKFRTMVPDADKQKAALKDLNEVNGVLFKIRKDPRLTPVGAWLRRWSLDEGPQLLNIIRGEMSLVGPRPWASLPYEEALGFGNHVRRRLAVKPGLTGLWQVSGRSDLPWEESVRLDLRYVENWSLALDLQILWKTWSAVIRGDGAY